MHVQIPLFHCNRQRVFTIKHINIQAQKRISTNLPTGLVALPIDRPYFSQSDVPHLTFDISAAPAQLRVFLPVVVVSRLHSRRNLSVSLLLICMPVSAVSSNCYARHPLHKHTFELSRKYVEGFGCFCFVPGLFYKENWMCVYSME